MANQHKVQGHRAPAVPSKPGVKVAGRRAAIEALNGGGFKTTLHHPPASEQSMMMGRSQPPMESAHKTYKSARKMMDDHMMEGGEPMSEAPAAQ